MLVKDSSKCTWYGKEITAKQYDEILAMLHHRPTPPEGFGYRLTESLEWVLYELPLEEPEEEEATIEDYQNALSELGVDV